MKIVICPLVSRDLQRSVRCVTSCLNNFPVQKLTIDVIPIINSLDTKFVREFVNWCEENEITYKITRSAGTAPRGKNSVLDFLSHSDYDGCTLVDGDDMLYPTAMQQVERFLMHHPGVDVMLTPPCDLVVKGARDHFRHLEGDYWCCLWGTHLVSLGYMYGPGVHPIFKNAWTGLRNIGCPSFISRKLASKVRYDEEQLIGEDILLELQMLKMHQEGEIVFWCNFASDVQLIDQTQDTNVQSQFADKQSFYYPKIAEKAKTFLTEERSSPHELPVEFPPLLFSYRDKIQFIREKFFLQ